MSWVPPEAPRPQRPRGRCLRGQALCVALRTAHLLVCWPRICGRGGTRSSVKRVPEFAKGEPQGPAPPPQCGQRSCCLGCPAGTRGHGVPASTGPQPVRSSPLCSWAGGPFGACHRGGSAPLVTSPLTLLPRPGAGPRPEPLLLIRSRGFCGLGHLLLEGGASLARLRGAPRGRAWDRLASDGFCSPALLWTPRPRPPGTAPDSSARALSPARCQGDSSSSGRGGFPRRVRFATAEGCSDGPLRGWGRCC